ncbi:hypothetical protein SS1G_10626 [Sclerotinia sclerotiorum 1980 UF-70]|uniref:Uncharacterized protein n=1 Tax=Sclerotinia sclerotiorum (strain ATCC 18683 / 1980 / Ss-1) TaxID=665079 RepID=A7EZ60_SCLS1|nr:hypothetical protein SS1G_10626 [Sclerotinia sclerotiorum 1980 UF-70]EDN94752.1 hypothetical protein SS1G_10626 [Sclerotinia sclerotiorum 1980 UF-70]
MTDTPSQPLPLDPREQPILESLTQIRNELTLLKQDRTTYIKAADVLNLQDKVDEQVQLLNEIRADKPHEQNRVDRVLDGCFQLLSLFFMTIGKTNEAPAAYSLTSTIKRLLDHLTEVDLYCEKDLEHIAQTLERLKGIVKNAKPSYSPRLLTLLGNRIDICQRSLNNLSTRLERISPEISPIHEKIISILRSISLANTRSKFSTTEVTKLQAQIKEIDSQRVDGKFVTVSGETPSGNDDVCDHLERCLKWAEIVLERKGQFPEAFHGTYSTLVEIRNKLEKLSLTQAWSLRETDLYDFQRQLDKIDENRVDGNFVDAEGNFAELYVQRTLLYLIRRSYAYLYFLMVSSEPVSEALLPVYNQLQTLRRCLIEVKNSGGLNSIDNMRVDGKFMVGPDIPEGQGSVTDLLAECFELSYDLRVAAENESDV